MALNPNYDKLSQLLLLFCQAMKEKVDPAKKYSIQERIGKGSFGEVYKA